MRRDFVLQVDPSNDCKFAMFFTIVWNSSANISTIGDLDVVLVVQDRFFTFSVQVERTVDYSGTFTQPTKSTG
jgi:hypothetical protein